MYVIVREATVYQFDLNDVGYALVSHNLNSIRVPCIETEPVLFVEGLYCWARRHISSGYTKADQWGFTVNPEYQNHYCGF